METKRSKAPYIVIVILLLVIIAILLFKMCSAPSESEVETAELSDGKTPLIGYQEGTTVLTDEDVERQRAALDDENTDVIVSYKNQAVSKDGVNFKCYFANPSANNLDMYFVVAEMNEDGSIGEEIYVSGLVRPGNLLEHMELTKTLPKGTYQAYLAMTQVEEDMETIHGQNTFVIQLVVE